MRTLISGGTVVSMDPVIGVPGFVGHPPAHLADRVSGRRGGLDLRGVPPGNLLGRLQRVDLPTELAVSRPVRTPT